MTTLTPRIHASGSSRLVAYDFGAHLAQWQVDGVPVIWCSPNAVLDGTAPIRGGVPICFPWFGGGPAGDHSPSHGVARTATWQEDLPAEGEVMAWRLSAADVAGSPGAEHLPGEFELRYAVSLTEETGVPDRLQLSLEVTNPGSVALSVEVALHTYLGVSDVRQVEIHGLEGAGYLDKVTGRREVQEGSIVLEGETDRVYDRSGPVAVADRAALRTVLVTPSGATQTVVWNPWADKAATMKDLGSEAWLSFVCVETAATGEHALVVPAGESVRIGCVISARAETDHVTP